jgi:predicted RNase H-like nuclease (RuvC/YqgF family)
VVEEEKIREQNLCEDRHREVSDYIQQLERILDRLASEVRDTEEGDDEYESLESEISRITRELDRAYTEQNELEEKLTNFGSPYWDSIDNESCSDDCEY